MSFLKSVLATITGILLSVFILFLLLIGIIASSSSEPEPYIRDGSVLKISLSGPIAERHVSYPFLEAFGGGVTPIDMASFRSNLRKAKSDSRLAGIWLDVGNLGGSWAHLTEMRSLIRDFKESGKFVYAYIGDFGANEAAYYVATVADSIYALPETFFEFDGFYIQGMFYKNAFEKFGLKADVVAAGDFKSAGDSYTNERFTDFDREQLSEILNFFSTQFVEAVSEYSGIDYNEIHAILNGLPSLMIGEAYNRGLIDGLMQPHEFDSMVKERTGKSSLHTVGFNRYKKVSPDKAGISVNKRAKKIAVVHAEGIIMPTSGSDLFSSDSDVLTYTRMKSVFDEIEKDKDIAAIVLRINSPGGSVATSEAIRGLVEQMRTNVPVIASMGPVAASGGYYIAMGADTVVAEPATITGSIGVIFVKLSAGELLESKLGITVDEIKTHRHADRFAPERAFTAEQRRALENDANLVYANFVDLVAKRRGFDSDYIQQYAQGRVWTGQAAFEIGLVDVVGTLPDAVRLAAEAAGLDEYNIVRYPAPKTFLETLMESSSRGAESMIRKTLGLNRVKDSVYRDLFTLSRPQAFSIIPLEFSVN